VNFILLCRNYAKSIYYMELCEWESGEELSPIMETLMRLWNYCGKSHCQRYRWMENNLYDENLRLNCDKTVEPFCPF